VWQGSLLKLHISGITFQDKAGSSAAPQDKDLTQHILYAHSKLAAVTQKNRPTHFYFLVSLELIKAVSQKSLGELQHL
jgi:hypothetical protein